ncbi:disease resistance protein RGA5-like [Triticum dicoccoides]|uniref:disease resistance protein RGA5-like n=1 Tax=Triticum dicoccoides TaxID=85692 RepID=UPI0018919EC2|nr:disease resistance protein RGA5-like [Triticum dicoccoides]
MQVAAGALSPLIRKLGDLLVDEFTLGNRVKKGVKSLQTELQMMYVFLHKVGDVPADELDPQVRIWADKVRELSYNMEDAVDVYMVRVYDGGHGELGPNNMKNRVKKFVKRTKKLFSKGMALHKISADVRQSQELAKELGELRQRYALEPHTYGVGNVIDARLKAVHRDITGLVGIEDTRDELIKKLFDRDEMSKKMLKSLSIVGFGGLGKTTLARAVYNKIILQFDCGVFISVSRNPNITKIFKKMLYGLDSKKFANINEAVRDDEQLIDQLRVFLQDKRYLIVIDDIWGEEAWEFIKCALSKNNLGSRVITTTRLSSVSQACCPSSSDIIHKMKYLNDKDSERLFYKRIFPQGNECPNELEQVAREILKKCGGVPLAIVTIASLLASNDQYIKPKYEWDNILSSIGRGLGEGDTAKDMQRILSFSYYDLPCHLKTCLLYLSIFPEDYEINRNKLIWRWIAEGLIHGGEQEIRLFELGERYFSELINRNLIQPVYADIGYWWKGCRLHDMNFANFKVLRVLDLEGCNLVESSHQIDLRKATVFANTGFKNRCVYGVGIGNLVSLEELKKVKVGGTDEIEKELGKLVELRSLDLYWKGDNHSASGTPSAPPPLSKPLPFLPTPKAAKGGTTNTHTAGHHHQVAGPPPAEPHHRRTPTTERNHHSRRQPEAGPQPPPTPPAALAACRAEPAAAARRVPPRSRPRRTTCRRAAAPRARAAPAREGGTRVAPNARRRKSRAPPPPAPVRRARPCPLAAAREEGGGGETGGGGIWAPAPAASRVAARAGGGRGVSPTKRFLFALSPWNPFILKSERHSSPMETGMST